MKNKKTIAIFIPHVGCPHDCVFCNQVKITGFSTLVTSKEIRKTIESHRETIEDNTMVEVAFFGGSFTAIDSKMQEEFLQIVYEYIESNQVDYIRISTRPDAINIEVLERLKKYGVKIIELGVQSLDEEVLLMSERGHNSQVVFESSRLIKSYGFDLGLQMMIGLPGDNKIKTLETARKIIKIEPKFVRIYPVLVLEETKLANMYRCGEYRPISLADSIDIVGELIGMFKSNQIDVIRVGLQNSTEISVDGSMVAGPFHPSLGELCYSRYYRNKIEEIIRALDFVPKKIYIHCPNNLISKFVGNKKVNCNFFSEKGISMKLSSWNSEKILIKCNEEEYYI